MYASLSDTELISRVLSGDQPAYAGLVQRYQEYVFSLCIRFTRNREDAEEVAQDVFIKAYKSLADYRGTAKFSTWLYTIAYTTSVTSLRKKRLDTSSIDEEKNFIQLANTDSGMNANRIEQKSKLQQLNHAISLLSADDAAIITLFYKGEQSLEETATILGIDANTAKVRLHRARSRLRSKLETLLQGELKEMIG
jgi:RNA polymerase sigma factor (sigma-70 family)